MKVHLNNFFQFIGDSPLLSKQFEFIAGQKDFVCLAVQLGAESGYNFTSSELESSIEACTTSGQGEYFCLPFGCWHKSQSD
jgi:hypothetical protein